MSKYILKISVVILQLLVITTLQYRLNAEKKHDIKDENKSELVQLLISGDQVWRDYAFFELKKRTSCPGAWKNIDEFGKLHPILEVIEYPGGKEQDPVVLVIHEEKYIDDEPELEEYADNNLLELFERDQKDCALKWRFNLSITAYDSMGEEVKPFGDRTNIYHGVIADINGDGFLERVDTRNYEGIKGIPEVPVLKVWQLKEGTPCVFAVAYNWDTKAWDYTIEDRDGDGIYEIILGPGRSATAADKARQTIPAGLKKPSHDNKFLSHSNTGGSAPAVTFTWDAAAGTYTGPKGGDNAHFRVIDPRDITGELNKLPKKKIPPGLSEMESYFYGFKDDWFSIEYAEIKDYNKPYRYDSLKDLSNEQILEFMGRGKNIHGLQWEKQQARLPEDIGSLPPKEAALTLVEMNRTILHRKAYRLAVDDRDGITPPACCRISCNSHDGCDEEHFFLYCTLAESFLTTAVSWRRDDRCGMSYDSQFSSNKFAIIPVSYKEALHLAQAIWWLNRVRSRRIDYASFGSGLISSDDSGILKFASAFPRKNFIVAGTLWSGGFVARWRNGYNKETCLNLTALLIKKAIEDRQEKYPKDDYHQEVQYKTEDLVRTCETFLSKFSFDESKIPFPFVTEAFRFAGDSGSGKFLPMIENIEKEVSLLPIVKSRSDDEIIEEIESLQNDKSTTGLKRVRALIQELWEVENETNRVQDLKESLALALKRIRAAGNATALEQWAKSGEKGEAWVLQRLKKLDKECYIRVLEYRMNEFKGYRADEAVEELLRIAPHLVDKAVRKRVTPRQSDRMQNIAAIADETKRVSASIEILVNPRSSDGRFHDVLEQLVPADNPLKYKDDRIDQALFSLLKDEPKAWSSSLKFERACLELARRGSLEYFPRIKNRLAAIKESSHYRELLSVLAYLAFQGKGKYLHELKGILKKHLRQKKLKIEDVIIIIWEAGLKELKDDLERIATSGPGDYQDEEESYFGGNPGNRITGRFHKARQICALWNEEDPLTRGKLLIAFVLADPYSSLYSRHPIAFLRVKKELEMIAPCLDPGKRGQVLSFLDWCKSWYLKRNDPGPELEKFFEFAAALL